MNQIPDPNPETKDRLAKLNDIHRKAIADFGTPVHEFTCFNCKGVKDCPWAFDLYNTNGDCLAEK